jgi:hypothetical protein
MSDSCPLTAYSRTAPETLSESFDRTLPDSQTSLGEPAIGVAEQFPPRGAAVGVDRACGCRIVEAEAERMVLEHLSQ